MAGLSDDDPFTWDIERVVKELCTADYTWTPTARSRLPDPIHLEARLRACEYDGEVLLDSMDHAAELWADLGITATKHKMALRTAIQQFRTRSPLYSAYKKSLHKDLNDETAVKEDNRSLSCTLKDVTALDSVPDTIISKHSSHSSSLAAQNDADDIQVSHSGNPTEPSKKKRRLNPTQLITVDQPPQDSRFSTVPISTEADVIRASMAATKPSVLPSAPSNELLAQGVNSSSEPDHFQSSLLSLPGAYWGNGKFSFVDIISFNETIDDDAQFGWGRPKLFGRARKRYVNGLMKRYLRNPNSFKADGDDDESALPVFGESDDDDNPEWQEIDHEIEEEEEEVRREQERGLAKKSQLQPSQVDTFIGQMVQEYISRWQENKLPVRQRQAFSLWDKARRNGTRNSQVVKLTDSLRAADIRLSKWLENLKDNTYSNENELRHMGPILEPTIDDIQQLKWHISVLQLREPPEKIKSAPVPKLAPTRKRPSMSDNDGIDIWDEDELDDFIVDDPIPEPEDEDLMADDLAGAAMDIDDLAASDIPNINTGHSFTSMSDGDIPMHDLTEVGPSNAPIDLRTPDKPLQLRAASDDDFPKIHSLEAIVDKGTEYWELRSHYKHLIITLIWFWPQQRKSSVFNAIIYSDNSEQVWNDLMSQLTQDSRRTPTKNSPGRSRRETGTHLARLFDTFIGTITPRTSEQSSSTDKTALDKLTMERIKQNKGLFDNFYCFLTRVARYYGFTRVDKDVVSPCDPDLSYSTQGSNMTPSQRAKLIKQQKQAKSARIRREEQSSSQNIEARKLQFRQQLESSALVPKEKSRLIINESKDDGKGLIFINSHISPRIQDHQIDGVRFMWDEITKKTKQGCLLAHTMGLGKTMQVITLLTAIAEAGKSEDESISSQVPEHLKDAKFLVLCPASLLDNWVEEFGFWAPPGVLGEIYYFQASDIPQMRARTIKTWAKTGSVLVMSYTLLRSLEDQTDGKELQRLIWDTPSLVVGDEAQNFKNSKSKTGIVASQFKTTSRIALTGSPLANNVEEYYSMINWVSPGFLGEPSEFATNYARPIEDGLWKGSDAAMRRRAKICLAALKKVVEPKVQRRTIAFLKDSIPPKKEYIIYINLGLIQEAVYQTYVKGVLGEIGGRKNLSVTSVWSLTAALRLLLAHPYILQKKLQEKQADEQPREKKKGSPVDETDASLSDASDTVKALVLDVLKAQQTSEAIDSSQKMLVLDMILEESMRLGENVLVFSQSLDVLDFVEHHLCAAKNRAYKRLDGKVSPALRQGLVKEFNRNKSQAFLISTTAGGVGLNIHGASRVVILDFQFNPVHEQQAIGRAYRIGQTKQVIVYWLICGGSFEKTMHNQQVFKNQLASRVVDAKNPLSKADNNVSTWFRDYQKHEARDKTAFRGQDPVLDALLKCDVVKGIPWIETTDTFEEEELDKDLPADAQQEADQMAHRQQTAAQNSGKATPSQQYGQVRTLHPAPSPGHHTEASAQGVGHETGLAFEGYDTCMDSGQIRALSALPSTGMRTMPAGTDVGLVSTHGSEWNTQTNESTTQAPFSVLSGPYQGRQKPAAVLPDFGLHPATLTMRGQHSQQPVMQSHDASVVASLERQPSFSSQNEPPTFGANGESQQNPQSMATHLNAFPAQPAAPLPFGMPRAGSVQQDVHRRQPAPPPAFGMDGAASRQQQNTAATPVSLPGEAARPITMGNTQEGRTSRVQDYGFLAKSRIEEEMKGHLSPEEDSRFGVIKEHLQAQVQMAKMGGMEKHTVWKNLGRLVKTYPDSLAYLEVAEPAQVVALLLKGGKSEESMHAMLVDLTKKPNTPTTKTRERDPDHVNKVLGRASKDGKGGNSASKQQAADLAAVHEIISRRQSRMTSEGGARQTQRGLSGRGGSISEPLVIDD